MVLISHSACSAIALLCKEPGATDCPQLFPISSSSRCVWEGRGSTSRESSLLGMTRVAELPPCRTPVQSQPQPRGHIHRGIYPCFTKRKCFSDRQTPCCFELAPQCQPQVGSSGLHRTQATTYIHKCADTYSHVHTYICSHTHKTHAITHNTQSHTHSHIYIYTFMHTYMHTQPYTASPQDHISLLIPASYPHCHSLMLSTHPPHTHTWLQQEFAHASWRVYTVKCCVPEASGAWESSSLLV